MKNKKWILSLSFVLIFMFFITLYSLTNHPAQKLKLEGIVSIGGQNVNVEFATTPEVQERGLSGQSRLEENEGMLFIFSEKDRHYFWMKDMNFPIDIIWVGEDFKILYIKKNLAPATYPNSYGPAEDSKIVLEVPAGFADKNNIKIGDEIFISTPANK